MPKQLRGRAGKAAVGSRGASTTGRSTSSTSQPVFLTPTMPIRDLPPNGSGSPTAANPPPALSPHASQPVEPGTNTIAPTPTRRTAGTQQSSYSYNPTTSVSQLVSQSTRSFIPPQYPNYTLPLNQRPITPQSSLPLQRQRSDFIPQPLTNIQHQPQHQAPPPNDHADDEEDGIHQQQPEELGEDYQQLLDTLLAMPGRENLPRLSNVRIPGVRNLW